MNSNLNPEVHFDSEKLKNRIGNNDTLYQQFITLIKKTLFGEISNSVIELEKCIVSEDLVQLRIVAHKIKGISLSSSFNRLAYLSSSLEQETTTNKEVIQHLLQDITSEVILLKEIVV